MMDPKIDDECRQQSHGLHFYSTNCNGYSKAKKAIRYNSLSFTSRLKDCSNYIRTNMNISKLAIVFISCRNSDLYAHLIVKFIRYLT